MGIAMLVKEYFPELFSSSTPSEEVLAKVGGAISSKLSVDDLQIISKPFTDDEIWGALRSMGPSKILIEGSSIMSCNKINVVLIPKKDSPETVADFRPIGLCNVVYKIIMKTNANRLKEIESTIMRFWWGSTSGERKIHWVM
ncbi:uncharacterized protein LOC109847332 [Asparagus officinalis]|uniref:uncharacterized protein LOC109847332 n=1 Tax=Asparagus officinalis TaxID=4686 RepID=UPI00098E5A43|nr:uncharacterized protein LOC109847332 [Asparagus officinalis]